jgi:hypothetical protein
VTDYDVLGFEANHCLVKYKEDALTRHSVGVLLAELVEQFGYPREILNFDYDKHLGLRLNNAVWDMDSGAMLKMGTGHTVLKAVQGYRTLSQFELNMRYGDPPKYPYLGWPKSPICIDKEVGRHWVLHGAF